jgi:hypothetical protein
MTAIISSKSWLSGTLASGSHAFFFGLPRTCSATTSSRRSASISRSTRSKSMANWSSSGSGPRPARSASAHSRGRTTAGQTTSLSTTSPTANHSTRSNMEQEIDVHASADVCQLLVSIGKKLVPCLKNPAHYRCKNIGLKRIEFYDRSDSVINQCHRIGDG